MTSNENDSMLQKFDAFITENMEKGLGSEKSRSVKIMALKYKCILIMTFLFIAILQFIYIIVKEILKDDKLYELLSQFQQFQLDKNDTNKL